MSTIKIYGTSGANLDEASTGPSRPPVVFLDSNTMQPIRDGIVNATFGSKWLICIVSNFEISIFSEYESGQGREVTQTCEAIASNFGKDWLCSAGMNHPIPIWNVPEPEICLGCGRKLTHGKCPLLLSKGLSSHRRSK